jgi:hypothetical protein
MLNGKIDPLDLGVQCRHSPPGSSCSGKVWLPVSNWQPCATKTLCHTGIEICAGIEILPFQDSEVSRFNLTEALDRDQ